MSHDPLQDGISDLSLIQSMGSDAMVVAAARVSFGKDQSDAFGNPASLTEKDGKLIRFLLKNRHTSPFEHTGITFHVACPLFVRSQWHRHRTQSYNEISRRYTSDDIEFYIPKQLSKQSTNNMQGSEGELDPHYNESAVEGIKWVVKEAVGTYDRMISAEVSREQARMILPQNLYTRFYATANLHNWMHFHRLRSDPHAQYEIRVYAEAIGVELKKLFPVSWAAYEELKG